MAITAYAVTPLMGAKLDAKASTAAFPIGTSVLASDGFRYLYVLADTAHASTPPPFRTSSHNVSPATAPICTRVSVAFVVVAV